MTPALPLPVAVAVSDTTLVAADALPVSLAVRSGAVGESVVLGRTIPLGPNVIVVPSIVVVVALFNAPGPMRKVVPLIIASLESIEIVIWPSVVTT